MSRQVIGIDFGTTYSSVALMEIGSAEWPRLLQFRHATAHVPTILLVDPNDQSVISWGWGAHGAIRTNTRFEVKQYFKRDLGVSNDANHFCLMYLIKLADHIRHTKNLHELSEDDFATAIGVPANWTSERREILKNLAIEAGFPDVRILAEPVAAMHNLRCQPVRRFKFGDRPEKYMVIDFGGGTLDICIVRTDELGRNPETIVTEGDPYLGGVDFDQLLENIFVRQMDIDVSTLSAADLADLRRQIQDAKEAFSEAFLGSNESAHYTIHLPNGDYSFSLSRIVFENYCRNQNVFSKIEQAVERALKQAALKPTEIRRVILTGGSSKWYFVKEIVSKKLGIAGGDELFYTETPFTDVACGLAIYVGRADEPPERPGVWVRMRVDSEAWSEYKVVLHPGVSGSPMDQQRLHLGTIKGSRALKSHCVEIEWVHGFGLDKRESVVRSKLELYNRSNHPNLERFMNVLDAAAGRPTTPREDKYELFLLYSVYKYGYCTYKLEIQDNRGLCKFLNILPGEDVLSPWLGFVKPIRVDHNDEQEIGQTESVGASSSLSVLSNVYKVFSKIRRGKK